MSLMAGSPIRVVALAIFLFRCPIADAACALSEPATGIVSRVIDGETLALKDGSEIRLIGAKAPLPPAGWEAGGWPIADKAKRALIDLAEGSPVELRYGGRRTDRYGHLLAHTYILRDGQRLWLQGEMVGRGLARVYSFADNRACIEELLGREREARERRRGLWGLNSYRVRQADDATELLRLRFSFQIVEGVVKDVGESRRRIYLNFSSDWRNDFTVTVAPGDRKAFDLAGLDLKALAGKRIRVRGWLEAKNGPSIAATHPEQIEIEAGDGGQSRAPQRQSPAREAPGSIDL